MFSFAGALPFHRYIWVEPGACGDHGWIEGVWFGLTSAPGRAWGCHVLLEGGAVYRNIPLHCLATRRAAAEWGPSHAQTWDCYGYDFTTIEYPFLRQQDVIAKLANGDRHEGVYWFTAAPIGDGFSEEPGQSKEFYFCALSNGRITAQPTNHVLIDDKSFSKPEWPTFLRRQKVWTSCE